MNKYFFIIKKLLSIKFKKFFFVSFINFFTVVCTTLSVIFIILVFSVNKTFKENVKKNIIKNDGYSTLYKKDNSLISKDEHLILTDLFSSKYFTSRLYNKNIIVRNRDKSSVSNMKCIDFFSQTSESSFNNVFNIENTLINGDINNQDIVVGYMLAEKLNIQIGDSVFLIYKDLNKKLNFKALQKKVSGIFRTNIPDFDNYTSYMHIKEADEVFKLNSHYESLVLNRDYGNSPIPLNDSHQELGENKSLLSNYQHLLWWEKYSYFLNWLNIYDVPINILLFFIMLITVINVCSSTYIDNSYRCNEIMLLNKLGLSKKEISNIFTIKSIILTLIGSILGFLAVQLLAFINFNYNIIEIPSEIYYMNQLPLKVDYLFTFIFVLLMLLLITIINYLTINKFIKHSKVSV